MSMNDMCNLAVAHMDFSLLLLTVEPNLHRM